MTKIEDTRKLKQAFLDEYEHFADQRIKKIDTGSRFIADDRREGDYGADRNLFLWFCTIFADVIDGQQVKVTLHGGVPKGPTVTKWLKANGIAPFKFGLIFQVAPDDFDKLITLSKAFLAIVAPGAPRYSVAAYKYVCPRTASSLTRLHGVLASHWGKGTA